MGWIVSRKHDFIFIHIPKTAGSSIGDPNYKRIRKGSLVRHLGPEDEAHQGHITARELRATLAESMDKFFTFCFVRNPWDRAVSSYSYFRYEGMRLYSRIPGTQDYYRRISILGGQINSCKDFKEFCDRMHEFTLDLHFEHQSRYTTGEDGENLMDFVGRFETIGDDYGAICDRIGIPRQTLPHFRKTKRDAYRSYYNERSRAIIGKWYEQDIELFKYQF